MSKKTVMWSSLAAAVATAGLTVMPPEAGAAKKGGGVTPVLADQGGRRIPVHAWESDQSVVDWYDHGGAARPYTSRDETQSDTMMVLFHRNTTTGELSLVLWVDRADDETGGTLHADLTGVPDDAYVAVTDDPLANEFRQVAPGVVIGRWRWFKPTSDGGALGGLEDGFDMTLSALRNVNGIDRYVVVSYKKNGKEDEYELDMDEPLRLVTPGYPSGR